MPVTVLDPWGNTMKFCSAETAFRKDRLRLAAVLLLNEISHIVPQRVVIASMR